MTISLSQIRSEYLNYFKSKGHTEVESSSLIPQNDPTLLFTNAGMVQFKDVFTGKKHMKFSRATTSQKCLRAGGKHNDLENVGYTTRHHTFFEMLGNFSFGDYFKEEVIPFAWELVTKILELEPEKLLVTVHSSDEEAASIWKKVTNFSDNKIIRIATNDNFWSMGDTGPCGPCTEIFYDHGSKVQGGPPGSKDADGDRFVEIWNLVFMQFETLSDGSRINLPKPSIDTGMGLERITAILQGVNSNFDIDLFQLIIKDICDITNKDYKLNKEHNNVIADHIRAITFIIADGIIPSNEGRGYVLRRIIRRALRHGYALDLKQPFLYKLIPSVIRTMGDHYKQLKEFESHIKNIVKGEEETFIKTIEAGMSILQKEVNKLGASDELSPHIAYKLYDTFGFPFDLTQDYLKSEKKTVNEKEFYELVQNQKTKAKKAWIGTGDSFIDKIWYQIAENNNNIEFIRNTNSLTSKILYIVHNNKITNKAKENDNVYIITTKTPFYPQSGGQIGDSGLITNKSNIAEVIDTQKIAGLIVHKCIIKQGEFNINDNVVLNIDKQRRLAISKNHTATHLLHKALKIVLGDHVFQQGSFISHEKLRFDFCHHKSLSTNEIEQVENIVLDAIDNSYDVQINIMDKVKAQEQGAIALFIEKYSDNVRVVTIGDISKELLSKELCGGEHVQNTAQIGSFKIIYSSSTGSKTQRIEAITGREVRKYLEKTLEDKNNLFNEKNNYISQISKELEQLKYKYFILTAPIKTIEENNVQFKTLFLKGENSNNIFALIDNIKQINKKICLIVANQSIKNDNVTIYLYISPLLQKLINNDIIIKYLNEKLNLNIKHKNELVQFGGINISKINNICDSILELIRNYNK